MNLGEKIICINVTRLDGVDYTMFKNWIVEGQTYHVKRIEGSMSGDKRLLLDEVNNPAVYFPSLGGKVETGFSCSRFANYEQYILGTFEENNIEKININ